MKYIYQVLLLLWIPLNSLGENTQQIKTVLSYYQTNPTDSLKYRAALFLINNMKGYKAPYGKALEYYNQSVKCLEKPVSIKSVGKVWKASIDKYALEEIEWVNDTDTLSADFLIENIEQAFEAWESAPWYRQISFDQFCEFILPYRVMNEQLVIGWRKELRDKYQTLIRNVTDVKEAFSILSDSIIKSVRQTNPLCPYFPDVLTIEALKQANCAQRCVLQIAILRSLAIPVAMDMIPFWSNYSTVGHTWVSLVLGGKTYTLYEKDKIAKQYNPIDASRFPVEYKPNPNDKYPFKVDSEKKASKIYRASYELISPDCEMTDIPFLNDMHLYDVSLDYGLNLSVTVPVESKYKQLCLCSFRTGSNWQPVAVSPVYNGNIIFKNVGSDIIYVVAFSHGNHVHAVTNPFLLKKDGSLQYFNPDTIEKEKVALYRKYPVFSNWSNQWGKMIGGKFEGANLADFSDAELLDSIQTMPFGGVTLSVNNEKAFRYMRYKTPKTARTPLAELSFYTQTPVGIQKLEGSPISYKVFPEDVKNAFDGKRETIANTKSLKYWIGIDLGEGKEQTVCTIKFVPKSDTNSIEPGHLYELFYFDKIWKSLGRQVSTDDFLIYKQVPKNAVLLLKDYTKGKEERIFYHDAGRQIWY